VAKLVGGWLAKFALEWLAKLVGYWVAKLVGGWLAKLAWEYMAMVCNQIVNRSYSIIERMLEHCESAGFLESAGFH
jgi:hypothetical protein